MIYSRISDNHVEAAGTVFGLLTPATIATPVYAAYSTNRPSAVSPVYALGFLVIFVFRTLYGIRFNRVALWMTNGIAVLVQTLLLLVISSNAKR